MRIVRAMAYFVVAGFALVGVYTTAIYLYAQLVNPSQWRSWVIGLELLVISIVVISVAAYVGRKRNHPV